MALSQNTLNHGARWSVMWLGKRGIVEKKFEDDFGAALKAYNVLKAAGKKVVTLRCCNVGFPPPKHITEHEEEIVSYRLVRRKGKRYKKKVVRVEVTNLMHEHNLKGEWWCPYCIQFRPFKRKQDKVRVVMYCPVCKITNYDFHVRRYNPQASIIEQHRRTRRGKSTRTRRRSR